MLPARLLVSVLAFATLMDVAAAQEVRGDIRNGRHLAQHWCGSCHRVATLRTPDIRGIPTFVEVARLPSTTALSLRAFLYTSHANMPNIQLSSADADDLIAFILSLKDR
jgi:mono/diheme cytochrome c family protein